MAKICGEMRDRKTLKTEIGVSRISQICVLDLPTSILLDILLRLPVLCIMNLKLVCKALYNLVSNHDFLVTHSKNSTFTLSKSQNLILLEINPRNSEVILTGFEPKIRSFLSKLKRSDLLLKDTCNGLVCLSLFQSKDEFGDGIETACICNPIMGDYFELPKHVMDRRGEFSLQYGLGFCKSANNYKVFRFVCKSIKEENSSEGLGEIFTIGVDYKWRLLQPKFLSVCRCSKLVTLNGVFHWLVTFNGTSSIFTFDIEEEKYGEISPPDGFVMREGCRVIAIHDQLICLVDNHDPSVIVIWKMKEYGVVESWTKDIIFEVPMPLQQLRLKSMELISRDGDIFFLYSSFTGHTILYNPVKMIFNDIRVPYRGNTFYAPIFSSLEELMMGWDDGTGCSQSKSALAPSNSNFLAMLELLTRRN